MALEVAEKFSSNFVSSAAICPDILSKFSVLFIKVESMVSMFFILASIMVENGEDWRGIV